MTRSSTSSSNHQTYGGFMFKRLVFTLSLLSLPFAASAQTQFFRVDVDNVARTYPYISSGSFTTAVGASDAGPIGPGGAFEFSLEAPPGTSLSFATMFAQSNDWFYAPVEDGIPLWEGSTPFTGDVTDSIRLWDAGTEIDEQPGVGENQAPRQAAPNTGPDENGPVVLVDDTYDVPDTEDVIAVTVTHAGGTLFTVRIENVSEPGTLMTPGGDDAPIPLSPGVWVVSTVPAPLFAEGTSDRGEGLEGIAEDGSPTDLSTSVNADTGVNIAISPGAWAVHADAAPFFEAGTSDRGDGLERIAEAGNPAVLGEYIAEAATFSGGSFTALNSSGNPGPATPGDGFSFTIAAEPGSALSFASMFGQSNDWFYSPGPEGIALWDEDGMPISGDVTAALMLWDAGTEVDELPGIGLNQAPRQANANAGVAENGTVALVEGNQPFPDVEDALQVTVTPISSIPFTVRIQNVSDAGTLMLSTGGTAPVPLSPGVWAVHGTNGRPIFTANTFDRDAGLEAIAEDGDPSMLAATLDAKAGLPTGAFTTPVGADAAAPIFPGGMYEITFDAAPGASLSLATMFVQSNDLFYAPSDGGIPLWDENGQPRTGDITSFFSLWDAGTEINQEPGVGSDQAPRQSGPNTGAVENAGVVRLVDDAYTYPDAADVIQVTIEAMATAREDGEPEVPQRVVLMPNYPNPFNPATTISYRLDASTTVRLQIVDALGREIARLVDGVQPAGTHSVVWNGRSRLGTEAPSGVYLYRLTAGNQTRVRSMVLVR